MKRKEWNALDIEGEFPKATTGKLTTSPVRYFGLVTVRNDRAWCTAWAANLTVNLTGFDFWKQKENGQQPTQQFFFYFFLFFIFFG